MLHGEAKKKRPLGEQHIGDLAWYCPSRQCKWMAGVWPGVSSQQSQFFRFPSLPFNSQGCLALALSPAELWHCIPNMPHGQAGPSHTIYFSTSQTSMCIQITGDGVKMQNLIWQVWDGAWHSACLSWSQVLLVQGLHFEWHHLGNFTLSPMSGTTVLATFYTFSNVIITTLEVELTPLKWNLLFLLSRIANWGSEKWFFFFFWPCHLACRIFNSPTRDWTQATAVRALSPNHWTTREFPERWNILQS